MATKLEKKGIIVTNITQVDEQSRSQVADFLIEANVIEGLSLKEVRSTEVKAYLDNNDDISFCIMWDKDYYLAKYIESKHITVYNNAKCLKICDDKALTYLALLNHKIPTPKTFVFPQTYGDSILHYFDEVKDALNEIGYPQVIKERKGSFGEQVYLVNSEDELKQLLKSIGGKSLIAQEYISYEKGVDYRVYVIKDEVVLAVKRTNKYDFRSNVNQGGTMQVIMPNEELQKIALKATRATGAIYAGVDIVKDSDDKYYVLEVNSNARTVNAQKVSEVNLPQKYLKAIYNDNSLTRLSRSLKKKL